MFTAEFIYHQHHHCVHFRAYHPHRLDQTLMTWFCLRRCCSDYHIGDGSSPAERKVTTLLTLNPGRNIPHKCASRIFEVEMFDTFPDSSA